MGWGRRRMCGGGIGSGSKRRTGLLAMVCVLVILCEA